MKIFEKRILTGKEKIFVKEGEEVFPYTCIAEIPREYVLLKVLDLRDIFGVENTERVEILKKEDEYVKKDEIIANCKKLFWEQKFRSPWEGKIKLILKDAGIIIMEKKEILPNKIEVNIFSKLGTKNIIWRKNEGDEVRKGEVIAEKALHTEIGDLCYFYSPFQALITHLNKKTGDLQLVDMEYPVKLLSGVYGRIENISEEEITIECEGEKIEGIVGVGKETFGELVKDNENARDLNGMIVFTFICDEKKFMKFKEKKVKGIITCFSSIKYLIKEIPEDYPLGIGEKKNFIPFYSF